MRALYETGNLLEMANISKRLQNYQSIYGFSVR